VPTSEEDAALSVVRFASELAWADAGPEVTFFLFLLSNPFLAFFLALTVSGSVIVLICWLRCEIFTSDYLLGT